LNRLFQQNEDILYKLNFSNYHFERLDFKRRFMQKVTPYQNLRKQKRGQFVPFNYLKQYSLIVAI